MILALTSQEAPTQDDNGACTKMQVMSGIIHKYEILKQFHSDVIRRNTNPNECENHF